MKTNKTIIANGKKVVVSDKPASSKIIDINDLGKQIKFKRTSLGLSIKKTASLCGISDKTLRLIESGADTKMSSVLNLVTMLGLVLKIEDK